MCLTLINTGIREKLFGTRKTRGPEALHTRRFGDLEGETWRVEGGLHDVCNTDVQ
jgi:hypothetical protein